MQKPEVKERKNERVKKTKWRPIGRIPSRFHCFTFSQMFSHLCPGCGKAQIVPVTVTVVSPGAICHSPVTVLWEKVAAGTVICPAAVAKTPVDGS